MTDLDLQSLKASLKASLPSRVGAFRDVLDAADERIMQYDAYVCDPEHDHANVYELCALRGNWHIGHSGY